MHNKTGVEGGLSLDTLSSYCDTNPVASSWLAFYDDCEGEVRNASQFGAFGCYFGVPPVKPTRERTSICLTTATFGKNGGHWRRQALGLFITSGFVSNRTGTLRRVCFHQRLLRSTSRDIPQKKYLSDYISAPALFAEPPTVRMYPLLHTKRRKIS